ncbi:hypothetical protein HmCmsJML213_02102 [Escherichia coli]|nr:hypothetical protein HmCmsJML213_02102 [Escherichia coli]
MQRAALEAGVIETLKYTVKCSEIVRDPAGLLEHARQTDGPRMNATGGRVRAKSLVSEPEADSGSIGR